MFCVAQVREWQRNLDDLDDIGARVWILTSDPAELVEADMTDKNLIIAPMAVVEQALWTEWGIENPSRPEIPQPTTYIVAPDGTLIWAKTTGMYSERIAAARVLNVIQNHRNKAVIEQPDAPTAHDAPIDWDSVLTVDATSDSKNLQLAVHVSEDFHVYGRKEKIAFALQVQVDGKKVRTKVPAGPLLHDDVLITARTGAQAGTLVYQACSGAVCGPPAELDWRVSNQSPNAGRDGS